MKKIVVRVITLILLCFSVYFGYLAYLEYKPIMISKAQKEVIKETVILVEDPDDPYNRVIDFETLKKINEDIVGWVYIPDTSVDYPILIGDDDKEYLKKDIYGNESSLGSIFSFADTDKGLSDARTVLLGHNMKQYQMFGELKRYFDEDFRSEHTEMYIYTEKKTMKLELFSMFVCKETDDIFWDDTELSSLEYQELLQELSDRNQYQDIEMKNIMDLYNNQSFSLVTCRCSAGTSYRLVMSSIVTKEKYIIN